MALIVSGGSRTLINGSASVVGRPFLDWTVFGMADKLLSRVFGGYIPASPLYGTSGVCNTTFRLRGPPELIRYASTFILLQTCSIRSSLHSCSSLASLLCMSSVFANPDGTTTQTRKAGATEGAKW
jgi:hypothetical protein